MSATCVKTFVRRNASARAMTAVLDEAGVEWSLSFGGKHPKIHFSFGGRNHVHPVAISPSDPYAFKVAARDVRHILAGHAGSSSEIQENEMDASTDLTVVPDVAIIDCAGEPRALDTDIGARLGMARPTNIRQVIEQNRAELETFGSLHAARAEIEGGKGAKREGQAYYLTEEQALLVSTISRAPNAPAVRAMLIRTFVAWRRGQLQPVAGGEDVGALLDLMGEQFDRVLAAIAAKGGLSEEDMRRLLRQHCEWEQRQHGRLRDEVHAGAGRVIKTLRNEPTSASLGDDVDLDAGYRACGIEGPIPARRKLSARVTNMVDAYCRKHRIPVGQIVVRGVEVKVWPRESFVKWFAAEGSAFIAEHIRRATAGGHQARPGEPNVVDLFSPQPGAR